MCPFWHVNFPLVDLDHYNTFCTILHQGYFLFSLLWQKQECDTGDKAVMEIQKKIKIGIPVLGTYIVSATSGWALGDENVIGTRAFNWYHPACAINMQKSCKLGENVAIFYTKHRKQTCVILVHFWWHFFKCDLTSLLKKLNRPG